ncbi:MAG: TonB-dependent receptor [Deltaproteobacteria bacterium]|nr:TonB-dependent receptor [Deltaproteobacteria bacterium]
MKRSCPFLAGLFSAMALATPARAQDIEVPILVMEAPETATGEPDEDLDLANIVQTAAKGVTTVQEAPAIVTVLPSDELKDKGLRNLDEALDLVPGWLRYGAAHSQFPYVVTRGTLQSVLLLKDGVSMFDPYVNGATFARVIPMESYKRVEVVTGPGGVLWGANSLFGVVNLITKDAEDVDGVEASLGWGTGPGESGVYRLYAMAGIPRLFSDKIKLFAHFSAESSEGTKWTVPTLLYRSSSPQPNSRFIYGPMDTTDPARGEIYIFDGKLSLGTVNVFWSYPWGVRYPTLSFAGAIIKEDLPEDPQCPAVEPGPGAIVPGDKCIDRGRVARRNTFFFYDRHIAADWRTRFLDNKAGAQVRAYFVQYIRHFGPIVIVAPIKGLLEGGLVFEGAPINYRAGGTFDGDLEIGTTSRLLYGFEAFHEWMPSDITKSRQGAGIETYFYGPYDYSRMPLPCPLSATWQDGKLSDSTPYVEGCPLSMDFSSNRTVLGAFASAQTRPLKGLILDGGLRVQLAPDFLGKRPYDPQLLTSAAVVYKLHDNWHLKLNYAEGFRAPVFKNTDTNGEAVSLKGSNNLTPERTQSFQTEVNARLLKGLRRVRELGLRADYSYSIVKGLIAFPTGQYINTEPRAIHSAELLAKLYLKGDHRIELGYTWLRVITEDMGAFKSMPENWFNLSGVISLIPKTLEVATTVKVFGAYEDPNRRADVSGLEFGEDGYADITKDRNTPGAPQTVSVSAVETVMDRLPPGAELQVGLSYRPRHNVAVSAVAYNALNARHYQPDAPQGYEPRLDSLPHPFEGFRFFSSVTVNY